MISLTEELFHGMGKRSFPTEPHIMFLYKIHEFLIKERPKYLNNLVYKTCFSNWLASKPEPQPSTSGVSMPSAASSPNCEGISGDVYSDDDSM
jgi:hypothetical protein